ncbi:MAG: hypothetical protein L0Y58_20425, partial [Verrucomicrobia subdivision 3 bacterium]|nr:hypothetical protein [Limisphaerales bacterium]
MKTIKFFAHIISLAVLLALPAAAQAQSAARTVPFELEGTWFLTNSVPTRAGMVQFGDTIGGQLWAGTVIGDSTLGTFSGTYAETGSGHHFREGMVTCEFRHGSLTFQYQYEWEGGTSILWTG